MCAISKKYSCRCFVPRFRVSTLDPLFFLLSSYTLCLHGTRNKSEIDIIDATHP
jgi:hypothetical protein